MNGLRAYYIILLLAINSSTWALDYSRTPGEDGYWNYEIEPIKAEQSALPEVPPPPAVLPPDSELMQMHPKQIQILVKSWRTHAIYTLDPDDVSEYLRIQDIARKKALAFSAVTGFVNQTNPDLSLADEIPITNTGQQLRYSARQQGINDTIAKAQNNYGLLYFTSQYCQYCKAQDSILSRFLDKFHYEIKVVDMLKNPVLANNFKIKYVPSIILVSRNSKKWIPLTTGATSLPVLKESLYRGVRYLRGEITPSQYFTDIKDINTGLDPEKQ